MTPLTGMPRRWVRASSSGLTVSTSLLASPEGTSARVSFVGSEALSSALPEQAAAGVLEGRECSAYPACAPEVRLAGGRYVEIEVTAAHVQGNLASAPAWPAHPAWLAGFLGLLGTRITL